MQEENGKKKQKKCNPKSNENLNLNEQSTLSTAHTHVCTIVAHNRAQNSCDNIPSYPPHKHACSDTVYWRVDG